MNTSSASSSTLKRKYKKENVFTSSIFESAFDELNSLEDREKLVGATGQKVKCPATVDGAPCSWIGTNKKQTFRDHVTKKHRNLLE